MCVRRHISYHNNLSKLYAIYKYTVNGVKLF
ncbi:hypothetical protein ACFW04_009646 [Cataglyphis niger]